MFAHNDQDKLIFQIVVKSHQERPISPEALRALYDHVGWYRPGSDAEYSVVLDSSLAFGAWTGGDLVGSLRALSDGHFAAYVEDVMVHARYRHQGIGRMLMQRLLDELGTIGTVNLICSPEIAPFYAELGFQQYDFVVMRRKRSRT